MSKCKGDVENGKGGGMAQGGTPDSFPYFLISVLTVLSYCSSVDVIGADDATSSYVVHVLCVKENVAIGKILR